ncbi:uncharacterized protein DEA37_0002247 [Paragonimus westermani]|uniref:Uncharacterized protein n=1 Tax=Paragonimus westermani TaxID=34504 RepID=A0A5J4NFX6_9TREM|nr:uncharacterized protein DEA37_0002247 [Paragonimus westermani]
MNLSFERDIPDKEWDSAFKLTLSYEDSGGCISHGIGTGSPTNLAQSCSVKKRSIRIGSSPNLPRILKCQKRRRLPGPAGMLPQVQVMFRLIFVYSFRPMDTCFPLKVDLLQHKRRCKSSSTSAFHSAGFSSPQSLGSQSEESELLSRLKTDCGPSIWPMVEKYSITNVLQMVTKGQLPRGKVPVMCGFLDDVELLPTDAKAVLKDSTARRLPTHPGYRGGTCSLDLSRLVPTYLPSSLAFAASHRRLPVVQPSLQGHLTQNTDNSRSRTWVQSPRMLNSQNRSTPVAELPRTPLAKNRSNISRPKPRFTRLDTSLSNSLDYRLHPQSTITGPTTSNAGLMSLPPMRPGLGSLIRSATLCPGLPSTRVTKSIGAPVDQKTADTSSDTTGLDVTANLLDDDMDELLSSLAEKSVDDLALA